MDFFLAHLYCVCNWRCNLTPFTEHAHWVKSESFETTRESSTWIKPCIMLLGSQNFDFDYEPQFHFSRINGLLLFFFSCALVLYSIFHKLSIPPHKKYNGLWHQTAEHLKKNPWNRRFILKEKSEKVLFTILLIFTKYWALNWMNGEFHSLAWDPLLTLFRPERGRYPRWP